MQSSRRKLQKILQISENIEGPSEIANTLNLFIWFGICKDFYEAIFTKQFLLLKKIIFQILQICRNSNTVCNHIISVVNLSNKYFSSKFLNDIINI